MLHFNPILRRIKSNLFYAEGGRHICSLHDFYEKNVFAQFFSGAQRKQRGGQDRRQLWKLNKAIERPTWPTESSSQLLRQISITSKYFVSLDLISGYYQVRVDEESQNILCITTPKGRHKYTVLGQGITSAPDIFNYLTNGNLKTNGLNCIKNMDDLLIFSDTLEGLKKELEIFL